MLVDKFSAFTLRTTTLNGRYFKFMVLQSKIFERNRLKYSKETNKSLS